MQTLLQLFIRNGSFVLFILLEVISFYLVVSFNDRQAGIFSNTTNIIGGNVMDKRNKITRYIHLSEKTDSLANENSRLYTELLNSKMVRVPYRDTFFITHIDSLKGKITVPQYKFVAAEVINNTLTGRSNWLTINRGSRQGIKPNMGVLCTDGLVGIVRYVSEDFAIVMSLLHRQTKVSASLKRQGFFGSLVWEGGDLRVMNLHDIPKHVNLTIGDTIITSGYSSMFPKGIMVGSIIGYVQPPGSNFYDITVQLSHDMGNTHYVYLVENIYAPQIEQLENLAKENE